MSSTIELVSLLGSQFELSNEVTVEISNVKKRKLYDLAVRNKVGLYYLERLKESGKLKPLEREYQSDTYYYQETLVTAINISNTLIQFTDNFAIFKFLKPYPHTPSDVDVLLFCNKEEYSKVVEYLINNGYYKTDECPSQAVVYDLRGGYENIGQNKVGGRFYIDLYKDVSASHVIYVNKETLIDHKIKVDCQGDVIQTLDPIADLVVVLTHSIIPEQLFTLGDYYTALFYIHRMDKNGLNKLAQIFKDNNITRAGIASLGVISMVHEKVYGFVPDKIGYLMEEMGWDPKSGGKIISDDFALPYRYSASTIFKVLAERMKNKKGLKSMLTQGVYMLDPRLMKWVVWNIIFRRTRETY